MPTRGRFVCHVHCLVHDGAVRSSPCRPHHENFGRNLYHMFVPAYSASQSFVLFWVVVFELLRSQMLIPYLPKRCSHTLMRIIILLDHRVCHVNPFYRRASLQVDPIISTSARSSISSPQRCCFIRLQVAFVFPTLPPFCFLQGLRFLLQVSILLMGSFSILFRQCSYPVILMKILTELQVRHSSLILLLRWIQFKLCIEHSLFFLSNAFLMPVHLIIIHFSPSICSGVLKISQKIRISIPNPFKLSRGCYLFWAI